MSEDTIATEIMTEFADVFKDELGILKGIEAAITVQEFFLHVLNFANHDPSHLH